MYRPVQFWRESSDHHEMTLFHRNTPMQSKDLIKTNLELSMVLTLQLIKDMSDAPLTFPTPNGGNHPLWVLGHLAYAEGALIQGMMLGAPNPQKQWKTLFDGGTEPVDDASQYPAYSELLAECHQARQTTLATLDSLSEEDLDQASKNAPPEYSALFGTFRQCFQMVANHWWMHRGQVADSRRAAGRDRLGP